MKKLIFIFIDAHVDDFEELMVLQERRYHRWVSITIFRIKKLPDPMHLKMGKGWGLCPHNEDLKQTSKIPATKDLWKASCFVLRPFFTVRQMDASSGWVLNVIQSMGERLNAVVSDLLSVLVESELFQNVEVSCLCCVSVGFRFSSLFCTMIIFLVCFGLIKLWFAVQKKISIH